MTITTHPAPPVADLPARLAAQVRDTVDAIRALERPAAPAVGAATLALEVVAASGLLAATVPAERGGPGALLGDVAPVVREIAAADASAGLVLAMHYIHTLRLFADPAEPAGTIAAYAAELLAGTASYLGGLVSERTSGSPRRGARTTSTATRAPGGWRAHGRKRYATGSSALSHAVVTLVLPTGRPGRVLLDLRGDGVEVVESWDVLGLRGTASNDLVLDDVAFPDDAILDDQAPAADDGTWSLLLAAVPVGIAAAARSLVLGAAAVPVPVEAPRATDVPRLRAEAGTVELEWTVLASVFDATVRAARERTLDDLSADATKVLVHRSAATLVEATGRVLGAACLASGHPWNQLFRDLRAASHSTPDPYTVTDSLGARALQATDTPETTRSNHDPHPGDR